DDVVQEVFAALAKGRIAQLFETANWNELWALLAVVTKRKCRRIIRRFEIEQCEYRLKSTTDPSSTCVDQKPSPAEAAVVADLVDQLTRALDSRDRQILELRLQGHEVKEISALAGCSERTVKRAMARFRRRLRELLK